jgi:hypothetical protein
LEYRKIRKEEIQMTTVIIRHKVEDYDRWKRGYDEADWLRKKHGILYASVHREETDPKDVIAVHQFKDLKGAKEFGDEVRPLMQKLGVIGEPDIWFAEVLEQVTYK